MGLFDYLRCKYPLPVEGANALEFQTKDTEEQYMSHYEIREDGTLWHEECDYEDRSDPNATDPLMALRGCMTPVNHRWVKELASGEIVFYSSWTGRYSEQGHDPGWVEFAADFVDGQIKHLRLVSNKPASDEPASSDAQHSAPCPH